MVSQRGRTVQKLVGSTLETVIASESVPEDMRFAEDQVFVTKEEVIYLLDLRNWICCVNPAESLEPVVVGRSPTRGSFSVSDLFVTDGGTIYVAEEEHQGRIFAFHPSSRTFREVLQCPDGLVPSALLVQERSLYVSMVGKGLRFRERGSVYEYLLPPELQLE